MGGSFFLETARSFETYPELIYLSCWQEETDIVIWVRDSEGSVVCQRRGPARSDFSVSPPCLASLFLFYVLSLPRSRPHTNAMNENHVV